MFLGNCPAMFDSSGKVLKKLDADWTTLTAYGGSKVRQFGIRIIKCFCNNQKWKFLFHTVDATGPIMLGLKTLKTYGDLCETPHDVH